jgi:hypothetical protein
MVTVMGKYLDLINQAQGCAVSAESAISPPAPTFRAYHKAFRAPGECAESPVGCAVSPPSPPFPRFSRFSRTLSALEFRCPAHVPVARWQQCIEDGRTFLGTWGEQAEAMGWTARDLFGLFSVHEHLHPSFSRLSRYDHTGLIWLLQGCPVIALTEATAAIQSPSGAVTIYRKHNKPGLGPVGDSLEDFSPPFGGDAA